VIDGKWSFVLTRKKRNENSRFLSCNRYVNFECKPCSTCEQRCVFDLGTYGTHTVFPVSTDKFPSVHYVEKLKADTVYSNISILPAQRNHYSIHVSELTDDYLSIHVAQTPTDNSTMLSLIALQEDRCPGDPPYSMFIKYLYFYNALI
jgi:hypothetical protein